ncbi:MAG: hypothetical protein KTR32_33960 [Granulosicoccus sp.]|nr:hypothetical protein [Granulosicoccus sp.]
MISTSTRTLVTCAIPVLLVLGCGGVTDDLNDAADQLGSALPGNEQTVTTGENEPAGSGPGIITGRVADGYLQGATVCVDINENGECDNDEPSATTGAGGTYFLNAGDSAANKPVIADVPPEAIDEDTGQPIGKRLLLSTLPDQTDFISPITTLVVEELKNNPGLSKEDAEDSVKDVLGLNAEDGTSLFKDYVANQLEGDAGEKERYRYLHQTARVVATMMDEIQERVEVAAVNNGIDVHGDKETKLAIRQLVRQEVRDALAEISLAVAEQIAENHGGDETGTRPAIIDEVDASGVAASLIRDELEAKIAEQLETIRTEHKAEAITMKSLLTEGTYWLNVDCSRYDSETIGGLEQEIAPIEVMMNDEGIPTPVDMPAHCMAEYGFITVVGEDNVIAEKIYSYDPDTGSWIEDYVELNDLPFAYVLQDGQWVAMQGDGPSGSVTFLEDGSALVNTDFGQLQLFASARKLDNLPVKEYLYFGQNDYPATRNKTDDNMQGATFPEGSTAHKLHIKRSARSHVLFNWYPDDNEIASNTCDEFGGNCNVIDSRQSTNDNGEFVPVTSLERLREATVNGIDIVAIAQNQFSGTPIDIQLSSDAESADVQPTEGTAVWVTRRVATDIGNIEPVACDPDVYTKLADGELSSDDEPYNFAPDALPPCVERPVDPYYPGGPDIECNKLLTESQQLQDDLPATLPDAEQELITIEVPPEYGCEQPLADANPGTSAGDYASEEKVLGISRWKVITVDDVEMIDIGLPVAVQHRIDIPEAASLLLIEHNGYVRRGAKFGGVAVDTEITWSEAAFKTLQPIAEDLVNH